MDKRKPDVTEEELIITGKEIGITSVKGRLLVVKEIAAFLRTSERWVNKHMHDGTFPFKFYIIGERNRAADSADLDEWLKKTAINAGTAPVPPKAVKKIIKGVSA